MAAVLLGTVTLASDTASMAVSSIDQSYKDLFIIWSAAETGSSSLGAGLISFQGTTSFSFRTSYWEVFNNTTSEQYQGNDSSLYLPPLPNANYGGGTAKNGIGYAYLADYSVNRDGHYGWINGSAVSISQLRFTLQPGTITLRGTGVINQVTLGSYANNLVAGSTMSVYGIPAGSGGATINS